MRASVLLISFLMLLLASSMAAALEAGEQLPDAAQEARARALSKEIRCVVCQAESIDESQAMLAQDMRLFVRQGITAGQTDDEILAALQVRYGDKVLMRPPLREDTWLLWLAPLALLALGLGLMFKLWRRA